MYLFIDTETGGLTPKHSLLTVSCLAVDAKFNIVPVDNYNPGLYLKIKHDEYALTAGALSVNKINLPEHHETATPLVAASRMLQDYVKLALKATGKARLIPAGHNVSFDVQFIRTYLLDDNTWNELFTYPFFDTAAIARFFTAVGAYSGGYSLTALRDRFAPHLKQQSMHNAQTDNMVTLELARKFADIGKLLRS